MSLIGDLEFRTIINNRPVIIKAQNTQLLGIEVLSENASLTSWLLVERKASLLGFCLCRLSGLIYEDARAIVH